MLWLTMFLLPCLATSTGTVDIGRQRSQYWEEKGLANPSWGLRGAANQAYAYINTPTGVRRQTVLFTIASPASVSSVLPHVLENLANFNSTEYESINGWRGSTLAQHTVVGTTNSAAQQACSNLTKMYQHKCYELDHGYNQGVEDLLQISKSMANAFSLGLSRMKALVDLVSLGFDVLYFDMHHLFFQNPLLYMYHQTKASIVVSSTPRSNCTTVTVGPDGSLPDDHHRLDMVFIRSSPTISRCLYNWLYWSCNTQHDAQDKPLDHLTFRTIMQECITSLGTSLISVEYLSTTHFPSDCETQCGCAFSWVIPTGADGMCTKEVMSEWVAFRYSCAGSAGELDQRMVKYSTMFRNAGLTFKR